MTLARSLWKNAPDDPTNWDERTEPFCTRCKCRVMSCGLVGTPNQNSSCMIATELDQVALMVLARLASEAQVKKTVPTPPGKQCVNAEEKTERGGLDEDRGATADPPMHQLRRTLEVGD